MSSRIKQVALFAAIVLGTTFMLPAQNSFAQAPDEQAASNMQAGVDSVGNGDAPDLITSTRDIVNLLLYIIGAVAVLMVIFGGFKYVTSAGDSTAVASAKNTILYAAVGVVVALLAYAIVNFVIVEFTGPRTWADCMEIENLPDRKKCQNRMIAEGVNDLPEALIPTR